MNPRALLLGPAALIGLLTVTGCGGSDDDAAEYGVQDRAVTVAAGDEFSLTLPASPTLNQYWFLTDPKPDADVLKYRGRRKDFEDSDSDGATGGTQSFDFTALDKGTATVRLLWCPMNTCGGPSESGAPVPTDTALAPPYASSTPAPGASESPSSAPSPSWSPYPTATGAPDSEAAFFVYKITVR